AVLSRFLSGQSPSIETFEALCAVVGLSLADESQASIFEGTEVKYGVRAMCLRDASRLVMDCIPRSEVFDAIAELPEVNGSEKKPFEFGDGHGVSTVFTNALRRRCEAELRSYGALEALFDDSDIGLLRTYTAWKRAIRGDRDYRNIT